MSAIELLNVPGNKTKNNPFALQAIEDLRICLISREASLLGRKEVLTGKAKFGILGDGKEVPQVAMARAFKNGDFRTGYYRDQTFMMAAGLLSIKEFFAQLYADTENDPHSGGRQMNSHYSTQLIDSNNQWIKHTDKKNVSADISCTAGQMARGLGLALASKKYRQLDVKGQSNFSDNGNEVTFITIGDASTSEGVFWETMNAAAVSQVPMLVSVWDDGYGISVPKEFQTVKKSISKALEGMLINEEGEGIYIEVVKGYEYDSLVKAYMRVSQKVRKNHIPALVHVTDLTQPQGHSTSGSHERYKSKERLEWEANHDCIEMMIKWMVGNKLITKAEVEQLKQQAKDLVKEGAKEAWAEYQAPFAELLNQMNEIVSTISATSPGSVAISNYNEAIKTSFGVSLGFIAKVARNLRSDLLLEQKENAELSSYINKLNAIAHDKYHTHLYCEGDDSALNVPIVHPTYEAEPRKEVGYQILNNYFDKLFATNDTVVAYGEDVGNIGDVNQGFAGLQEKYGIGRIWDEGIREWTIMGQSIGLAQRGFRPIAEIQYLDYIVYGLEPLVDDLTTLRYRSNGTQMAPAIIRTRGHRLEGIWHAGSPLGMLTHALRGMYLAVPRNMVQAVGMYNTLMQSNDPALVIEPLNSYRYREALPMNIGEYTVALGQPDIIVEGTDVTIVTYGSMVRIAEVAVNKLKEHDINVELIDVQTLLPFDVEHSIVESLKKTNKIIFLDEDIPGGATSYMMQQVLEVQGGYKYLDHAPMSVTAHEHRTPFGSDGDYFTKPNEQDIFEAVYKMMHRYSPSEFPVDLS